MVRVSDCGFEGCGFKSHYSPENQPLFRSLLGEIGRRNRFKICFSLKVLVQVQH